MKICASYHIPVEMWNDLDEIRFSTGSSIAALDYAGSHPEKKVIIETLHAEEDNFTPEIVNDLLNENPNLYFDFYDINDLVKYSNDIRRFMYHYPANTFNMMYFLLQFPISDITIGEPLTFDLDTVREAFAHMEEFERPHIRVNPAIGRPSLFNSIGSIDDGLNHFWILPQHTKIYDEYIDVVDLLDDNATREETLVKLFKKGSYANQLRYYLRNGENPIYASLLDENLAKRRINCRQTCMRGKRPYRCNYCSVEAELYKQLSEKQKGPKDDDNPIT